MGNPHYCHARLRQAEPELEKRPSTVTRVRINANLCNHTDAICLICYSAWEADYIVNLDVTPTSRRLKELLQQQLKGSV